MKNLRFFVCALLCCASTNSRAQDLLDSFGHLARWLPLNGYELRISAAFGRSDLPYVIYDPLLLDKIPTEYLLFMVLRQDYVAAVVSADPSERKRRLLRDISGTQPIDEESLYENPRLGRYQAQALDCLAYRVLNPSARKRMSQYIRDQKSKVDGSIPIWPTKRYLLLSDFAFLESSECHNFAERFALKKE